jgi:hypothetical protein
MADTSGLQRMVLRCRPFLLGLGLGVVGAWLLCSVACSWILYADMARLRVDTGVSPPPGCFFKEPKRAVGPDAALAFRNPKSPTGCAVHFGVVIATYQRESDPQFLVLQVWWTTLTVVVLVVCGLCILGLMFYQSTSLASLARQTYTHWTLLLMVCIALFGALVFLLSHHALGRRASNKGDEIPEPAVRNVFAAIDAVGIPRGKLVFQNNKACVHHHELCVALEGRY